jgi:hypothetical protein
VKEWPGAGFSQVIQLGVSPLKTPEWQSGAPARLQFSPNLSHEGESEVTDGLFDPSGEVFTRCIHRKLRQILDFDDGSMIGIPLTASSEHGDEYGEYCQEGVLW